MYRVAGIESSPPPRYGWLRALGALLGGSIIAYFGLFVFAFVLGVVVHMLPGTLPEEPGVGWPWRIDGAWSALADLGPLLLTGALVAAGVGFYVGPRVGHPTARWPIVLCATLVGWVPIAQSGRGGLLPVSGGLAFVAMWWTTRKTSEMPRWRLPAAAISPRVALTAVVAAVIALAAVSIAYSTLHPVRVASFSPPETATLFHGKTDRFPVPIYNEGPLPIRILAVSLPPTPGLRLARVERSGPRTEGPTIDSLYSPAGMPQVPSGAELSLWLTLTGPTDCIAAAQTVAALDVHVAVAGLDRSQRVRLGPHGLQVNCRPSHHS
jgi:hypothetical protein